MAGFCLDCARRRCYNFRMKYDVAIIGAGASGLYLASLLAGSDLSVALIEAGDRVGRKLSATGNGQGNLTNTAVCAERSHGDRALISLIAGSDYESVLGAFPFSFSADSRGRVYPLGRQASALTDALRRTVGAAKNIDVMLSSRVRSLEKGYTVIFDDGRRITADKAVLCTGGKAQKQLGSDGSGYEIAARFGHTVTSLLPSLVQIKTDAEHIRTLKGLRADCMVTARSGGRVLGSARGDVIFADYGVTGSAVFSVSYFVTGLSGVTLDIAFLPDTDEETVARDVRRKLGAGYEHGELLSGTLNNQIGRAVMRRCPSSDPAEIARAVKHFTLSVQGTLGFDSAQVTRGGIPTREVTDGLESVYSQGLYFAGEILDVDGECGGFNLHWAFSCARRIAEGLLS